MIKFLLIFTLTVLLSIATSNSLEPLASCKIHPRKAYTAKVCTQGENTTLTLLSTQSSYNEENPKSTHKDEFPKSKGNAHSLSWEYENVVDLDLAQEVVLVSQRVQGRTNEYVFTQYTLDTCGGTVDHGCVQTLEFRYEVDQNRSAMLENGKFVIFYGALYTGDLSGKYYYVDIFRILSKRYYYSYNPKGKVCKDL